MRLSVVCIKSEEYFRFISFREAYRLPFSILEFHLLLELTVEREPDEMKPFSD